MAPRTSLRIRHRPSLRARTLSRIAKINETENKPYYSQMMIIAPIRSAIRLLAATFVACAFVLAPMADAQHAEPQPAATCEIDHTSSDTGDRGPDNNDHEHHVNHCGSCHIYALRKDIAPDYFEPANASAMRASLAEDVVFLPPGNPYRPPRA